MLQGSARLETSLRAKIPDEVKQGSIYSDVNVRLYPGTTQRKKRMRTK